MQLGAVVPSVATSTPRALASSQSPAVTSPRAPTSSQGPVSSPRAPASSQGPSVTSPRAPVSSQGRSKYQMNLLSSFRVCYFLSFDFGSISFDMYGETGLNPSIVKQQVL